MAIIKIKIEALINADIKKVWEYYTNTEHMIHWNFASEDWHCPRASGELKVGGRLNAHMEAKDGSFGFDFTGTYEEIDPENKLVYVLDDDRRVETTFESVGDKTHVCTVFEAESENSPEIQKSGWQAILDNFKKYTEEI